MGPATLVHSQRDLEVHLRAGLDSQHSGVRHEVQQLVEWQLPRDSSSSASQICDLSYTLVDLLRDTEAVGLNTRII
jgi:hypothetical protein